MPLVRRGLLYMLGAAFFFSLMAVLVKAIPRIPAQEKVFVRSALNVAFTLALMWRYRVPIVGRDVRTLVLRGAFGYLALSCHFFAIGALPLALALVLHNTSPLLVAVLAPLLLRERTEPTTFALAAVGFAGVALILRPEGEVRLLPGLVALLGGLFASLSYITVRALGQREHPLTVVLYFPLVSAAASLVPTIRDFAAPTAFEAAALVGIGLATTIAQILVTAGLRLERAAVATPVANTGVVFGAAFGAILFGERPDLGTWLGAAAIILSTIAIARRAERSADTSPPAR